MIKTSRYVRDDSHRQRLVDASQSIKDASLSGNSLYAIAHNSTIECVKNAVGFHHAGLDRADRKFVEELFKSEELLVIFSTTTMYGACSCN